jgi:hypothetical protein
MDSEKRDKAVIPNVVSYVAFESVQARNERHIKRLWITNIILIALLFLSNAIWLWFYSSFDFESYDYEQDGSGINIIGDDNEEVKQYGAESKSAEDNQTDGSTRQDEAGESENG